MTLSNLSSNMLDAMNGTVGTPELATSTSVPSNPGHHLESLANSLLSRMNEEEKNSTDPLGFVFNRSLRDRILRKYFSLFYLW